MKRQIILPDEFIVVDSSTNKQTKKIIQAFKKTVRYPVYYIYEPRSGFPVARNHVLKKAKHQWVAFTDDDCITDPLWISSLKHAIAGHPSAAAIAGESKSWYPNDIISLATMFNETHWKSRVRDGEKILDLETLDNKNVAYNLAFFRKNNISYDESRGKAYFGASDDCDLGMQIQKSGGKAFYNPNAIVYHKDLITLASYSKRLIMRSFAHATYENKWRAFHNTLHVSRANDMRFLPFFIHFIRKNKLTIYKSILLFMLLVYTSVLIRYIRLYIRIKSIIW
jgi:GT2 family glycosyltransferase